MNVTSPKTVLYVITKGNWGGAQRYAYDLAVSAQEKGFAAHVAYGTDGELIQRLTAAGVETHHIRSMDNRIGFINEIRSFRELLRLVQKLRPDVIHGNSSKAGFFAALAGRFLGVPKTIFTAHGWAFNEKRPWWQRDIFWLFHYATILFASDTICVSSAVRSDIRSMPFVQKKLVVIHNGVSPVTLLTKEVARRQLAPNSSAHIWIGTVAELHPTKQLHILIEAFAALSDQNTQLVIIGDGTERVHLEARILDLHIGNRVQLCGHVPQANTYLKAFDMFALPSLSEALGYVLLEAGAAETAVVASNVGGIPEIITDGVTGTLVPSGDIPALTSAIQNYIDHPEIRAKHAEALKKTVLTDFSMVSMTEKTFAMYL
ncbi:glycosyltransferase family 4 protein [Patescibacteria group bacterium]|nr:glycosyltransferase family 4 protein [Patescibacteria group bacterium]MBU1755043.1 glycosyltransferase family 4 protein [Patescibacteria group bacterium]